MFHKSFCQSAEQQHSRFLGLIIMLTEAVILRLQFLETETTPGWRTCCPTLHTASRWSPSTWRALGRSSAGMVAQVRVRYTPSPFQGYTHLQGCENKHHKSTRTQESFLTNIREAEGAEKQGSKYSTTGNKCLLELYTQENQGLLQLRL